MDLIIVESPTKARTLTRFLGDDFAIRATAGHVEDLPKSKFGVDLEHDFQPEYVAMPSKKPNVDEIKKLKTKAKNVYLATDPDREGEAIAYHVGEILQINKFVSGEINTNNTNKPMNRIVFHEITESAVKNAIAHPRSLDMDLVDAQQARRVLDRIVGYKLSPLLWKKVRVGLSAGRVQSVTVRLIVDREREIEAFKPEEYWEILAEVSSLRVLPRVFPQKNPQGDPFLGDPLPVSPATDFLVKLIQIDDKRAEIKNKEQADVAVTDLEKASYQVKSVEKKEVHKNPYPPFTTSTMTQAAARLFSWSAKRTMSIAQKLYEEGLITYHRSDSTHLAPEAVQKVRDFITSKYGKEYVPEKFRFYKVTSKVAQEAHEAIRPTEVGISNGQLPMSNAKLGNDGEKLYELIWKRFVACQMNNAIYDETTINVNAQSNIQALKSKIYLLQAKGQVRKFDGWKKVYGRMEKEEPQLPDVAENEQLQLIKIEPQQKFTEPPARYNEASLIKTLEKLGIGRPSTYAPTISTISTRQYVEKVEGKFKPTSLGIATNDFLLKNFPEVFDYQFTAKMEDNLDQIANGKEKWVPVIREFWQPFEKKLALSEKAARVKIENQETGEMCPECKIGKQVIRIGRFGKFLSCSRFPDCKWKAQYVEKAGMTCPECKKGEVIVRLTKKHRKFFGCSRYPNCKFASWKKPQLPS
ncbi:type I DNA topoisomerase [Candidatus Microgenomates bacterium]|nr:type I DNA topoisomerase [Candidatus Microgenomates bacterium]